MINFHLLVSIFCEFVLNDVAVQLLLSPKVTEALFTRASVKEVSKLDCLTASLDFDMAIFDEIIQIIETLYHSKDQRQKGKGGVIFRDLSLSWEMTHFPEKKLVIFGVDLISEDTSAMLVH